MQVYTDKALFVIFFDGLEYGRDEDCRMNKKICKSVRIFVAVTMSIMLIGCNNTLEAKKDYNNDNKIANQKDHYYKNRSVLNTKDNTIDFTVASFDGRETLWSEEYEEEQEIQINIGLEITEGHGKLVHVDEDGTVTTIVECRPDSLVVKKSTYTVPMKKGKNKIKFVGYDCKDIALSMEIKK